MIGNALASYLVSRQHHTKEVAHVWTSLTDRERRLVKEAAVMGYVQGAMRYAGAAAVEVPPDRWITSTVIDACLDASDLYPTLSGKEGSMNEGSFAPAATTGRGNNDGHKPGDVVAIRGTIISVMAEQAQIEVFSKTDQYNVWIRNKDLTKLVDAEDADEPEAGALVELIIPNGDTSYWKRYEDGWMRVDWTGNYSPWLWRTLKGSGTVTKLYRDGEV